MVMELLKIVESNILIFYQNIFNLDYFIHGSINVHKH